MNREAFIQELEQCGIGLERGTIALVDYSPAWAAAFDLVERRIRPVLGDATISHMGSTAIPGCIAKPILDVSVVYDRSTDFSTETAALVGLGFFGRGEHGIPGRTYFDYYDDEEKISYVHVHAYPEGHAEAAAHEQFKAALLRDAACVARYNALKRKLLASGITRADYPAAKTDFILGVLAQAQHG